MKYFTVTIVWLTFVICTVEVLTAKVIKHREFFYSNVSLFVNEKYVNASKNQPSCATESRESPCKITPQVNMFLLSEVARPYFYVKGYSLKTNRKFIEQFMNVCSLTKAPGLNIFVRMLFDQLKESVNFSFDCPFQQGFYEAQPFKLSPTFDLLMNFFRPDDPQFIGVDGKNKVGEKMETVFTYKFNFEVVDVPN